jgi:hypothetical protein
MAIIVNTSVDDISSSLRLINPKTGYDIREDITMLNHNLAYEAKNKNRTAVLKLLRAKINKIKKLKPGR